MDNSSGSDFEFFATGKRVKESSNKSPLQDGLKWMPNEKLESSEQVKTSNERQAFESSNNRNFSNENFEELGNVGTELQKHRLYPEKKYDKMLNKMVLFNPDEYFLIRDLASEISFARKKLNIKNKDSLPRITENTIIRAALKSIFSKMSHSNISLANLQTEEQLEKFFNSLLKN